MYFIHTNFFFNTLSPADNLVGANDRLDLRIEHNVDAALAGALVPRGEDVFLFSRVELLLAAGPQDSTAPGSPSRACHSDTCRPDRHLAALNVHRDLVERVT